MLERYLKHPLNIHETLIKNNLKTLKKTWNILELTLKPSWNIIKEFKTPFKLLEISLKHSWSTPTTWLNHLWNFLEILFKLLWNNLHTPSKHSSIFLVILSKLLCNNNFLEHFLKHPWNIHEISLNHHFNFSPVKLKDYLRWKMIFSGRQPLLDPCMLPTLLCGIFVVEILRVIFMPIKLFYGNNF